jgi:predicted DNA-binding transcriptional regulator AlpA
LEDLQMPPVPPDQTPENDFDEVARLKAERRAAKLAKSRESLAQTGFPVLLRFVDLEAAGIVQSWAQLGHLIKDEKFPAGILLSSNIRAWRLDAVQDWLASRPTTRPPPEEKLRERDRRTSVEEVQ